MPKTNMKTKDWKVERTILEDITAQQNEQITDTLKSSGGKLN